MKRLLTVFSALAVLSVPAGISSAADPLEPWRHLPVLHGGRVKPFDTYARETVRIMTGRESFRLEWPDGPQRLQRRWDPVVLTLELIFTWPGWEKDRLAQMHWMDLHAEYWASHEPDDWDRAPLLLIQHNQLKQMLGFDEELDHVAPVALYRAQVTLPAGEGKKGRRTFTFFDWGRQLRERLAREEKLTTVEQKAWDLWNRYMTFITLRMGTEVGLMPTAPPPDPSREKWLPLAVLIAADPEAIASRLEDAYSDSALQKIRTTFYEARAAYLEKGIDSEQFLDASWRFVRALRELGLEVNKVRKRDRAAQGAAALVQRDTAAYPASTRVVDIEVHYNHLDPFGKATILYVIATVLFGVGLLLKKPRWAYWTAMGVAAAATAMATYGFVLRSIVAGHAMGSSWRGPVVNLYETVVWVAFFGAAFGLGYELYYRRWWFATAASAVAAIAMLIATNTPSVLDPTIAPIEPVLRTNLYLVVHVLTIVSSYAAGALAWAISLGGLALYLFTRPTPQRRTLARELAQATYRCIQAAVLLLAAGTILGGVWAYDSWGRFWGWDPKEVWALISLLCYMIVLHGRYTGMWNVFGLLLGGHLCFLSILMSWYGVNFVLPLFNEGRPVGLHGYALGRGGLGIVSMTVAVDLLFAALASWRYARVWMTSAPREEPDLESLPTGAATGV